MKNAVIGFILILILVFTGMTIYTIEGKTIRQNELDSNLGTAMEQSMEILTINPTYMIEKDSEGQYLIADFIENFLVKTTSDSTFTIEILAVDAEKGLLDVRAKETFKQFIGTGTVECRKTVLLEDYKNEKDEYFEVSFYAPKMNEKGMLVDNNGKEVTEIEQAAKEIVKQINVYGGGALSNDMLPTKPEIKGYQFTGWKLEDDGQIYTDISMLNAMKQLNFTAVFTKGS